MTSWEGSEIMKENGKQKNAAGPVWRLSAEEIAALNLTPLYGLPLPYPVEESP